MLKDENQRREITSPVFFVTEKIPLVSVVIPMYNAAQFISQTLESLLNQTMKDFEVIVIDDCSTDNSLNIVKSFWEKFDSRLHVIKLPKNGGAPGVPRNVGIQFAHGKYIAFLDADDLYTPTALEELSTLAEEYQADVVHTDTFFLQYSENITVCQRQTLPVVSEPTFETGDISQRVRQWLNRGYNWEPYTNFCRRDFLTANQITFPKMSNNEDMIFAFHLLCTVKTFLRVPNCTYFYSQRPNSVSKESFNVLAKHFQKWLRVMKDGFKNFDEVMSKINFFGEHSEYRYAVKEFFFNEVLPQFLSSYIHNPACDLSPLVEKEFHNNDAAFTAYLFDLVNIYRLQILQLQEEQGKF